MKTYLPYFMRKIGITLFFLAVLINSASGIDDILAGLKGTPPPQIENIETWQKLHGELIFSFAQQEQLSWIGLIISVIGLLIYVLSKERVEDEYLAQLRAKSMVKAVACSWGLYVLIKPLNWLNNLEGLHVLHLQIIIYVMIYVYQKRKKY